MDPNACFKRFLEAMDEENFDDAFYAISDLSEWYYKGGFPAKYPGSNIEVPENFVHNTATVLGLAIRQLDPEAELMISD